LLEFALILPLFLILVFGIIEFALINASIGAFNFATQDAARYGAITGPTDPNSDASMLTSVITPRINQIIAAQLVSVEIFKANEDGSCYGGSFSFPCPTEDIYNAQSQLWTYGWPTAVRNDQLVVGDYLGVRITYVYTYVTAFFATTSPAITLTAESVQRIEPQEYTKRSAPRPVADGSAGARAWVSRTLPTLAALNQSIAPATGRLTTPIAGQWASAGVRAQEYLTWGTHEAAGSMYVGITRT
jgi:hypothetical protein